MSSSGFLEPVARGFIGAVNANANNSPPLNTIGPEKARAVLEELQASDNSLIDADVDAQELKTASGLRVVLFTPKSHASSDKKLPIVLYTHGGGWVLGSPNTHARLMRDLVKATGFAFAFPDYTNAPEGKWDSTTKQTFEALTFIADNAEKYNLDGTKIAVAGDSAGGNLAIANTIQSLRNNNTPKISAAAILYPTVNLSLTTRKWDDNESFRQNGKGFWLEHPLIDWVYRLYAGDGADRENVLVSPLLAGKEELEGFPATMVLTVEHDPLRDEGEEFARHLADAGVDVFNVRVNQTVHDFMLLNPLSGSAPVRGAVDMVAGYLKKHLA